MSQFSTETAEQVEIKLNPLYKVLIHNDDVTPIDYVVFILGSLFGYNEEDAYEIAFKVHNDGFGLVGIYTYEIASDRKSQADKTSESYGYPLKLTIEEDM